MLTIFEEVDQFLGTKVIEDYVGEQEFMLRLWTNSNNNDGTHNVGLIA